MNRDKFWPQTNFHKLADFLWDQLSFDMQFEKPENHINWLSSNSDLQEVGLVCQWNGLRQGNIKRVGWDAAQEGHGVRAPEEGVVLTRFSWNWVLVLVLQSWTWGKAETSQLSAYALQWPSCYLLFIAFSTLLWLVSSSFSCSESSLSKPSSKMSRFLQVKVDNTVKNSFMKWKKCFI